MNIEDTMTLAEWFTNPLYFGMLLTIALICGGGGFAFGMLISRPFWDYIAEGRRFKREDKEKERRRQEEAKFRFKYGFYWNEDNVPHCPTCRTPLPRLARYNNGFIGMKCPRCNKHIIDPAATLEDIERDFPAKD